MENNYQNLKDYVVYFKNGTMEYFNASEQWDLVSSNENYLKFEKLNNVKDVECVRYVFVSHISQLHQFNKGGK